MNTRHTYTKKSLFPAGAACIAVSALALCCGAEVFEFTSGDLKLAFGDNGRIVSLCDAAGAKYLSEESPWVGRADASGKWTFAEKASRRADGAVVFSFGDGSSVVESVKPFDGGFAFTVEAVTVPDGAKSLTLASLRPRCSKYVGGFASALSDDELAVCLRSFDFHMQMYAQKTGMKVVSERSQVEKGMRFGLAAGRREGFLARLRSMVEASGLFYSKAGGPWSLGSAEARQSYVFANMGAKSADAWIDMVKRSGASILHLHAWNETLGHNKVSRGKYPRGIDDMKAVADKAHAAGLSVSIHSLTACIDFRDSWVTPVAHSNLIATYTYTLSKPLVEGSTELVVDELPGPMHDLVTTYTSNGNYLWIGGEIVSYTGIRREKPYAFTGIKRGDLKTKSSDHPAGSRVKYLQQRYFSFYPEPDSQLAVELADRLAGVYNTIGADMIYFDGSEGMKASYGTARMAALIAERLDSSRHPPRIEMSCLNSHFWPFRSTIGAWDNVRYGPKTFEDSHIRSNVGTGRNSNFLDGQMGWWAPQLATKDVRSRFPDETEYFAAKNAGFDFAMSLQGISANPGYVPDLQERALTLVGWYERFRLAHAFAPAVQAELGTLGREGRLGQDGTGAWTYTPVEVVRRRVVGKGVGDRWSHVCREPVQAALRVEAFYGLSPFDSPASTTVFDAASFAEAKTACADKVRLRHSRASDPERGEVTRIEAFNDRDAPRGAYGCFERTWPKLPYLDLGAAGGVGFWVKGDGSGAILNVQLHNGPEYANVRADNFVKLDFKGWRYVELLFRERDTDEALAHVWPYRTSHPEQMSSLRTKGVKFARLFLNEIPVCAGEAVLDSNSNDVASKAPAVDILVSDIKALGLREMTCEDVRLRVNGKDLALPFDEMAAGDWAELDGGVWNLYGEKGDFKARAAGPELTLKAGENKFRYSASAVGGVQPRAEVTVFALGKPLPALAALTPGQRAQLDWEAEMPANWAPSKGADSLPSVKVRPGEKARLEVKIRGPVADPVVKVGEAVWKLATVPKGAVRTFTDGPVVSGVAGVSMESSDPTAADALVEFVKCYVK